MKEIDLLPEWYKNGRRRQLSIRVQCMVLVGLFLIMTSWSFVSSASLSKARAEVAQSDSRLAGIANVVSEFNKTKSELTKLEKKAELLAEIDSKVSIANVLAELSFLIDEKIVLKKLNFKAECFAEDTANNAKAGSVVRKAGISFGGMKNGKNTTARDKIRFKVIMSGVATDAGDVARLICKLEDSTYFSQVYPSYSRDKELKIKKAESSVNYQASEFEISCYLANYRMNDTDKKINTD